MASIWPALRLLTAILRIVALVVLVPVMGPAHAGAGHAGAGHSGSGHAGSAHAGSLHGAHLHGAIGAAITVSADSIALIPAAPHDGVADPHGATGPCCPGCCFSCSAFLAVPAQDMTTSGWIRVGRIAPGSDRPHPSVVPEAIPEPPRPFA